ncbi:MAG: hypothetical protein ACI9ES_002628 [Oceanospirillaceae bacterium]
MLHAEKLEILEVVDVVADIKNLKVTGQKDDVQEFGENHKSGQPL